MTKLSLPQKSILIVDDSPIIAERLHQMLKASENMGVIWQAMDYATAIRLLAENHPDVVLLDINIPGKSGISLLQYIKGFYSPTIVIMITNQADDFYRTICKRMGADYFIDKSKDFEQIPLIIASLP